ncbi:MAG: hypothetical protein LBQ84_03835 [Flavobacteriaceae bacterium]|jgi:hypothetical protein|nr:hypothetical protein [Flavobacteriaceae bacterium]
MKKYNFTGIEAIFDYKQPGFLSPYRRSVYLVLVAIMLGVSCMEAQVTIGGDKAPAAGSLLSLNSDTKGGLQLSNVSLSTDLTVISDSFPGITLGNQDNPTIKEDFKGAMVYNTNPLAGRGKGIYTWNGGNWDFVGNTRHFEVPDYANGTDVITGTGEGTWKAYGSGFVICTWGTEASISDTGVWIDNVRVISSNYTETGYGSIQEAMVPIAVGQVLTVKSPVSGVYNGVSAKFYPLPFVEKQADNGYSFNEVKTNDIWVDSKPIYKKTVFRQDYTFDTNHSTDSEIIVADVFPNSEYADKVLKLEGTGYLPDENQPIVFIGSWVYDAKKWTLGAYYKKVKNNIIIEKGGNTAIKINDFTITLYYTKIND